MPANKTFLVAICSLFLLPYLPTVVPTTAVLTGGFYLHDITALAIILPILVYLIYYPLTIKVNITQIVMGLLLILLVLQSLSLDSYKSFSYMAIAVLTFGIILSIAISSLNYSKKQLLDWIAVSIIINCYLQIIICLLQIHNIKLYIPIHFYDYAGKSIGIGQYNLLAGDVNRIVGSIYQTNLLANTLTTGLLALCHISQSPKKWIKLFFLVSVPILCCFISLTYSRTPILYCLFILTYAIILLLRKQKPYATKLLFLAACLVSCTFLAANGKFNFLYPKQVTQNAGSTANNDPDNSSKRLIMTFKTLGSQTPNHMNLQVQASNQQRLTYWQNGISLFKSSPISGVGWDYYAKSIYGQCIITPSCQFRELSLPFNAHNIFIQLLATTGILGFILILFASIYWFIKLIKLPVNMQLLPLGFFGINFLHSQVEYPLFYNAYLFGFITFITLADDSSLGEIKSVLVKPIFTILTLVLAWQIYIGVNNFFILAQFKEPRSINGQQSLINSIITKYQISFNPFWDYYADTDMALKITPFERTNDNYKTFDIIYNALKRVTAFTPYTIYITKLAILEQIQGNRKEARQLILNMLKVYPEFYSDLRNCADLETRENKLLNKSILEYFDEYQVNHPELK